MKKVKVKKGFLDGYKTYDPKVDGFGSPDEWRDVFQERFGYEKAVEILGENNPLSILGVNSKATWEDIKVAYRKLAIKWHPDKNKSEDATAMMKKINAAFEVLEKRFKK